MPPCPPYSPRLSQVNELVSKDRSLPLQLRDYLTRLGLLQNDWATPGRAFPRGLFGILFTKPRLKTLIDQRLLKILSSHSVRSNCYITVAGNR